MSTTQSQWHTAYVTETCSLWRGLIEANLTCANGPCPNCYDTCYPKLDFAYCSDSDGKDCWDSFVNTADCWSSFLVQLILGMVVIIYAALVYNGYSISRLLRLVCRCDVEVSPLAPFFSHIRNEENFMRGNSDPDLITPPGPANPDYAVNSFGIRAHFAKIVSSDILSAVNWFCLGCALLSGSLGTLVWLLRSYSTTLQTRRQIALDTYMAPNMNGIGVATECSDGMGLSIDQYLGSMSTYIGNVYGDFKFFPMFLVIGYLSFVGNRWRSWMVNGHSIKGTLHNLCLAASATQTVPVNKPARARMFKIYRWINSLHVITYMGDSLALKHHFAGEDPYDVLMQIGLLTENELPILRGVKGKERDTIIAWLAGEIARPNADQAIIFDNWLFSLVSAVRGKCASHAAFMTQDNANLFAAVVGVNGVYLLLLIFVGFPLRMVIFQGPTSQCFQPLIIISCFLLLSAFLSALTLAKLLKNAYIPVQSYGQDSDDLIDADALLSQTEGIIFAILRGQFDVEERDAPCDTHHHLKVEKSELAVETSVTSRV